MYISYTILVKRKRNKNYDKSAIITIYIVMNTCMTVHVCFDESSI